MDNNIERTINEKQTRQYISMCFISLAKQLWPSYMMERMMMRGDNDADDDDDGAIVCFDSSSIYAKNHKNCNTL